LDNADDLGLEEIFADQKNIVVIEWPEKILDILPKHHIEVKIRTISENEREFNETIY